MASASIFKYIFGWYWLESHPNCALPFQNPPCLSTYRHCHCFKRITISAASLYTFEMMPIFGTQQLHQTILSHQALCWFLCGSTVLYFCHIMLTLQSNPRFVPVLSSVTCPICKVLLWNESFSSHISTHQIKCIVWLQVMWCKKCSFSAVWCVLSGFHNVVKAALVFCTGSAVCLFKCS